MKSITILYCIRQTVWFLPLGFPWQRGFLQSFKRNQALLKVDKGSGVMITLNVFLYGDAVFHAAGQKDEVLKVQSCILIQDLVLDLLQLHPERFNQFQGQRLGEVFLCVLAQRNLGKNKQQAVKKKWFHFTEYWIKQ